MDKLKHCPFCGSESVTYIEEQHQIFGLIGAVHCRKCSARGAFILLSKGKESKEAVDNWNERANILEQKKNGDSAKVVRCGKCKHYDSFCGICQYLGGEHMSPSDFCSYGEENDDGKHNT